MSDPVLISTAELDALMKAGEKLVLIDTRDPQTYAEGHLPGARFCRDCGSPLPAYMHEPGADGS